MLVLSRKLNEKIVFPGFKTVVQILSSKPGLVRLGIEAPSDVKVLREEVHDRAREWGSVEAQPAVKQPADNKDLQLKLKLRELNHLLRNRLNGASLGLAVLSRQLQAGLTQDAELTLAKLDEDFQMLNQRLEGEVQKLQAPPVPAARKSKALLVEDNANECELLATFLRMADMEVATAGDGTAALDHLHSIGRPDVVLLDMGLPRCDGPTMVREIRRDPAFAGMKIFAVTGHAQEDYDLDIGPAGVDRWFRKPLDPRALLRDLHGELSRPTIAI